VLSRKKLSLVDARGHLRLVAAVALLFMWVFGWAAASAQAWPELDGVVSDDTGRLDAAEVNRAASELSDLGVQPLAVLSQNGSGLADSLPLGYAAANQYGFGSGGDQIDPNLFAIVVLLGARRTSIIYGDELKPIFEQTRNGTRVADDITSTEINPNLAAGDFTAAFSEGFRRAAQEISLYRNPPTPTTAPTPAPPVVTNVDTSGLGSALLWCVGIAVLLGAVGLGGPVLFRQWKRAQEAAARKRALQDQLVQARNVTADMITDLDFPADPAEQIQYRFLALALERERPAQLADVTKRYREVYGRVSEALALYNTLNQAKPATEQELTAAIAQYQSVQATIQEASAFLQQLAEMSRQVEGQVSAAPGETDAAKKALAAATDSLAQLAAAAPDLYAPSTQRALKPVADRVAEAESALAAQPPLSLKAYDAATAGSASAAQLLALIGSLAQAYHALRQQRARLVAARSGGFKLPGSDKTFAHALDVLSSAARHLEAGELEKAGEALKEGVGAVEQAGSEVAAAASLQKSNQEALAALKSEGEEAKKFIEQGATTFDKVDEYAESSWQDIKGNGTEAQKAADKAFNLWQEASRLNELSAEGPQDFEGARRQIEEANGAITRVRELITAILDRMKHLQESQRTAQAEISAAEQDLALGRSFVKQHDPDISPAPDRLLADAAGLISQAKDEISKGKPDWIKVVALARQANDLADRALAGARSEHDAMQARRLKVQTTSQQAAAGLSRAANFATAHRSDIDASILDALARAEAGIKQAQTIASRAEGAAMEDRERAQALEEAASALLAAQQAADNAYNQASQQFAFMEGQRREASAAMKRAESAILEADRYMDSYGSVVSRSSRELLNSAIREMPGWRDGADASMLAAIARAARAAQQNAEAAHSRAQAEVEAHLEAERQRERERSTSYGSFGSFGGFGSSSSSGSSGSSWGGGGSSSSSWGSGGSSSSSWGSGGSSSSSWGKGGSSSSSW
jgi:uncharacterized membrane protein YgcG